VPFVILSLVKFSFAAFDYREVSQTSLFQFNAAVIDYSIPGDISNPAYYPLAKSSYLMFSGSNPYSLENLFSGTLKAGGAVKGFGAQISWNRFGFDQYAENILEAGISYMFLNRISIGVSCSYYNLAINTDVISETHDLFNIKSGLLIIPFDWLNISGTIDNIISLFNPEQQSILFPEWSAGIGIRPVKGLFVSWNINGTAYGLINSFYISANILPYLSLRAGYAKETSSYSGSVLIVYKHLSLSYGLKYHPHLGFTHSAGITLTLSAVSLDSVSYSTKFEKESGADIKNFKRVNINTCTADDLKKIPGISKTISERLIKYREIIGPVTKNSLVQVGMSQKEADSMLDYIYGLEEEKKEDFKPNQNKAGSFQNRDSARKAIFEKLNKTGIGALPSMKLSEMAVKKESDKINDYISAMKNVSEDQKLKVRMICSGQL
jgi:hypothetical protein